MDIDRYICQARSEIRSNEMHMFLKHARSNNTETCEPIISNESYQRIDKNSENNAATKESTERGSDGDRAQRTRRRNNSTLAPCAIRYDHAANRKPQRDVDWIRRRISENRREDSDATTEVIVAYEQFWAI